MRNKGMGIAVTGVFTVCMAVGSEPIAVKAGIAGLVIYSGSVVKTKI